MKSFVCVLLFTFYSVISFAQTKTESSEHFMFKGVPLDGPLDQYVAKMKQNGFMVLSSQSGFAMLQGDFAGYKDCFVGVSTLKQKDLVYKIDVLFSACDSWSLLYGNYNNLKQMLTEKYGKPSEVVEKFDRYSQPDDDNKKFYEVKLDRCKFSCVWNADKGSIFLIIDHKESSCFVKLSYFDKINGEVIKKQALDDL